MKKIVAAILCTVMLLTGLPFVSAAADTLVINNADAVANTVGSPNAAAVDETNKTEGTGSLSVNSGTKDEVYFIDNNSTSGTVDLSTFQNIEFDVMVSKEIKANYSFRLCASGITMNGYDYNIGDRYFPANKWIHVVMPLADFAKVTNDATKTAVFRTTFTLGQAKDLNRNPVTDFTVNVDNIKATKGADVGFNEMGDGNNVSIYNAEAVQGTCLNATNGKAVVLDTANKTQGNSSVVIDSDYKDTIYFVNNNSSIDVSTFSNIEFDIRSNVDLTTLFSFRLVESGMFMEGYNFSITDAYIPANQWIHVSMPLSSFQKITGTASLSTVQRTVVALEYVKDASGNALSTFAINVDNIVATKGSAVGANELFKKGQSPEDVTTRIIYDADSILTNTINGQNLKQPTINTSIKTQGSGSVEVAAGSDSVYFINNNGDSDATGVFNANNYTNIELDVRSNKEIVVTFSVRLVETGIPMDGYNYFFDNAHLPANTWVHVSVPVASFAKATSSANLASVFRTVVAVEFAKTPSGTKVSDHTLYFDNLIATKGNDCGENKLTAYVPPVVSSQPEPSVVEPSVVEPSVVEPSVIEPSEDVTSEVAPSEDEPNFIYGDLTGDGLVKAEDALMALQYSVSKITLTDLQKKAANVDGKGSVSASDALAILQYSVNKISRFPVEDMEVSDIVSSQPAPSQPEPSQPEPSEVESNVDIRPTETVATTTYSQSNLSKYGNSTDYFKASTNAIRVDGVKSVVQTNSAYSAMYDFDVDAQMVNIFDTTAATAKLKNWADKYDGKVSIFTPLNRGGADYPQMFPNRTGKDEQTMANGTKRAHATYGYYMIPTSDFISYKKKIIDVCLSGDYEVEMVVFEEPEIFINSVYCQGFKEEWQKYYGTAWEDPTSSASARYKNSRLAVHLFETALTELSAYVKSVSPNTKVIIAAHSAVNYDNHGIVSGITNYANLPGVDGVVGQTWSDTIRVPMQYNGTSTTNLFLEGLVEYAYYAEGMNNKWAFTLTDAATDSTDSSITEDMKRTWYLNQLTAQFMYAGIQRYENMIWPSRAFGAASDDFKTVQLNMITAQNEITEAESEIYSGTNGVYIGTSDTLSWQKGIGGMEGRHNHYALTVPLAEKGILPNSLNLDTLDLEKELKNVKVLLLSYDYQKPINEQVNAAIAAWVKSGGVLLYVGGQDDYATIPGQWWTNKSQTPFQNLMAHCEVGIAAQKNNLSGGSFEWKGNNVYCQSFTNRSLDGAYASNCMSFAGAQNKYPITAILMNKGGATVGIEANVNKGKVICFGISSSWFGSFSGGADCIRQLVQYAVDRSGMPYWHKDMYLAKRGNIMAAYGLGATQTLNGKFVDLTNANLPVVNSMSITKGNCYIFKDISEYASKSVPSVVHYGGEMVSLSETANTTTMNLVGSSTAYTSIRILGNGKTYDSITVQKSGKDVATGDYTATWDASTNSLLFKLKFKGGNPYDIVINWK